jgi:glucose-6-phosphate isomerase
VRDLDPSETLFIISSNLHDARIQGAIWSLDSFNQWGVELGKVLAQRIIPELEGEAEAELGHHSSTNALIRRYPKLSGGS